MLVSGRVIPTWGVTEFKTEPWEISNIFCILASLQVLREGAGNKKREIIHVYIFLNNILCFFLGVISTNGYLLVWIRGLRFLGSPYERNCYFGVSIPRIPCHRAPNHQSLVELGNQMQTLAGFISSSPRLIDIRRNIAGELSIGWSIEIFKSHPIRNLLFTPHVTG